MKNYFLTLAATSAVAFSYVVIIQIMEAESSMPKAVAQAAAAAADGAKPTRQEYSLPSAVNIPSGYHDGKLIVMSHPVTGEVVPWRPQFDNEMAINAFEAEALPISDNATTAALLWNRVPSKEQNKALAGAFPALDHSFLGPSQRFRSWSKTPTKQNTTVGWEFPDFKDGAPAGGALHKTSFSCHESARVNNFVFIRYAPSRPETRTRNMKVQIEIVEDTRFSTVGWAA